MFPNDPDQIGIGSGIGIDFEKFGIWDWDLGCILKKLGFGIGIWDVVWKIRDLGLGFGMEFGKFGIWDWDLGFSFKNSGFGIRSESFRDWDGIGIPNADLCL